MSKLIERTKDGYIVAGIVFVKTMDEAELFLVEDLNTKVTQFRQCSPIVCKEDLLREEYFK